MKIRRDRLSSEGVSLQARAENDQRAMLAGYAVVTNQAAECSLFTEEIDAGALTKALGRDLSEVRVLWQHDHTLPIAKFPESLELVQDERGLFVRFRPIDTADSADMIKRIEAGLVSKMSFGFYILEESMLPVNKDRAKPHFIVRDLELVEVSPVTYPFYPQTEIGLERQAAEERNSFAERLKAAETSAGSAVKIEQGEVLQRLRAEVTTNLWAIKTRNAFGLPLK